MFLNNFLLSVPNEDDVLYLDDGAEKPKKRRSLRDSFRAYLRSHTGHRRGQRGHLVPPTTSATEQQPLGALVDQRPRRLLPSIGVAPMASRGLAQGQVT